MNPVRPYSIKSRSSKIADISNKSWYYTYVLWSEKNAQFHTGTTSNLRQRLKEHTQGLAVSTKHKRPLRLIYFEACLNKGDAYRRERYLKTGRGKRYLKNRIKGGLTG